MMVKKCVFSADKIYRYTLWRHFIPDLFCDDGKGYALFIGLNPSTATDEIDDPTIRRCINFAKYWGFSSICMCNLFAYRATDPSVMKLAADPVGPENDKYLLACAEHAGIIVAAWGSHGAHQGRDMAVKKLISNLHYLRLTKDGHPGHPLYLPKTLKPIPWVTG